MAAYNPAELVENDPNGHSGVKTLFQSATVEPQLNPRCGISVSLEKSQEESNLPCRFGALFSMRQGNASADEQSLNDQCRAKVRAQIKGPACQKSQADRQSDPCYIGGLEAMKADFYTRTALCVDRRKSRTHMTQWIVDRESLID